jgi:site-specific DNA-methyltransferase (adenine-specific)
MRDFSLSIETTDHNDVPRAVWASPDGLSRLYHGDCLRLLANLPESSVDCIWTDPPYFLSNDGVTCQSGKMVAVNKGEWDRSMGVEADHEFNLSWLRACHRVLKPAGCIWVSGTHHVYFSVGMAMMQIGYRVLNDVVWEKPAPPPNLGRRCFTHATEALVWATKATKNSKDRYTFHYDAMRDENGGKQMKNVWRFPAAGAREKRFGRHPTQKPVALIGRCLRASTNPGDVVLDPFAGSSTTGVAAIGLGRHYIGCERDAAYAYLSAERLRHADPSFDCLL